MDLGNNGEKRRFNRIYGTDYLIPQNDPPVDTLLDALLLEPDNIVVEVGTGDGHFTLPIAKRLSDKKENGLIFGFDYSETLIERLDRAAYSMGVDDHLRSWPLSQMKENALPIADNKADRVLAVNFLQYLPDPLPMLREMVRLLKPGGILLIVDWTHHQARPKSQLNLLGATPDQMCATLQAAGIGIHVHLDLSGYNWVIRALKPSVLS